MTTHPAGVVFDAADPHALAGFWSAALGWPVTQPDPGDVNVGRDDGEWGDGGTPCFAFVPVPEPKVTKNRVHLDLASASAEEQRATVDRLLALGAREVDIGQGDVPWVVLADPEGNELCVLEPREDYAGAPGVAAVVVDCADPRRLAGFWRAATGWEVAAAGSGFTALRHPSSPTARIELVRVPGRKLAKNRVHVDVVPGAGGSIAEEVARLEGAGATRIDVGQGDVPWVVLADPEGNELCVLPPRD